MKPQGYKAQTAQERQVQRLQRRIRRLQLEVYGILDPQMRRILTEFFNRIDRGVPLQQALSVVNLTDRQRANILPLFFTFAQISKQDSVAFLRRERPDTQDLPLRDDTQTRIRTLVNTNLQQFTDTGRKKLSQYYAFGLPVNDIRRAFLRDAGNRSAIFARTTATAVNGIARDETFQEVGAPFKRWITIGDNDVRTSHKEAGKTQRKVPLNDPFIVAGDKVDYPPHGYNCRCHHRAVFS